jgi:peptidoglycan-associated lipoprotein
MIGSVLHTNRTPIAWVAALALGAFACASTPEEPAPAPKPTGSEFQQGRVQEPAPEPPAPTPSTMELGTVYFDFDKSEIRDDAKPVLRANAQQIEGNNGTITIEGHCDERGDEEYNLALGERRATAVKRYLANLGVPDSRMRTISYGEAKPAVQGHNESAWRWNRRAEFRVR